MSGAVGAVLDRKDRPAIARFKRVAVENKAESLKQGKFIGDDVDYALITPMYSKDVVEQKVSTWFEQLDRDVAAGRIPADWVEHYRKLYAAFQRGEEAPLQGTAIKGWGVISPAQEKLLLSLNILTVEDLAGINDEGCRRIGMGALELRTKAIGWLAQLNDKGPLTQEIAAVRLQNEQLSQTVVTLQNQVTGLIQQLQTVQATAPQVVVQREEIAVSDILDDEPAPTPPRAKR